MSEKIPTAFGMVTPAPKPSFLPDEWARGWAERLVERQERMMRNLDILSGIDPDNQPTVGVRVPRPAEFLAKREEFAARWEALVAEGLEEGYLEHDHCYDCGGELGVTTDAYTVESRPNPDFDPDKPNPYAQNTTEGDTVSVTMPARARNVIITRGDPR